MGKIRSSELTGKGEKVEPAFTRVEKPISTRNLDSVKHSLKIKRGIMKGKQNADGK